MKTTTNYDQQAADFLAKCGIAFRATLSDSKTPAWDDGSAYRPHYRVTLSSRHSTGPLHARRLTFDFWGSINDGQTGEPVSAYSVLACISSDANCPETFEDFCAEYGEDEDSRKALQTFRRCAAFGKRLRAFFTADELAALAEIN